MVQSIAVTGATGFAGRHAVSELVKRGFRVTALVRNPETAGLPAAVRMVTGDLQQAEALDRLVAGADAVIHLAGAISGITTHDFFRVNAHGTVALAEAAVRAKVRRFIHISSLAARQPALSAYGASKRAGEDAVAALAGPLGAVLIRPPAVYGPGDRATLPLFRELTRPVAVIPGRAENRFALIHVSDLARIIADAASGTVQGLHEVSDETPGGYGWADLLAIAEAERRGRIRPLFLPQAIPQAVALVAEGVARLTGRASMVSRGKIAELYHHDWVTRPSGLAVPEPITFVRGFPETLAWYRRAGWLPGAAAADRSVPGREEHRP